MARSTSTMKVALGRIFKDRQILIRSEQAVRFVNLRRRDQVFALGVVAALVAWGGGATLAWMQERGRSADLASQILDLEIGYARLITDFAASRPSVLETAEGLERGTSISRHIIERNNELERQLETVSSALAESEAVRSREEARRQEILARIDELEAELAAAGRERMRLERHLSRLSAERDRLAEEGSASRAKVAELEQALGAVSARAHGLEDQIEQLTTAVRGAHDAIATAARERGIVAEELARAEERIARESGEADAMRALLRATYAAVVERSHAQTLLNAENAALKGQVAGLESELDNIRNAQEQLFAELRQRTDDHIAKVEEGLSFTGLDIDSLIEELRADVMPGAGGPMIPMAADAPDDVGDLDGVELIGLVSRAAELQQVISRLPLAVPLRDTYQLSSSFGSRRDPFTGRRSAHHGLDFAAPRRTPVYATAPGTVITAGRSGAFGNLVEIDHGLGVITRYAHLHRIDVSVGDEVAVNDRIGQVGTTGRSTGPHLHYEILVDDRPRNPANFLKAGQHVFQVSE